MTLGEFPMRFLKCCFHICIRPSWLAAFSFALEVLFLLLTLFYSLPCYSWLSLFYQVIFILLIWLWMYSFCSFWYVLVCSLCTLSFCSITFVGFLLLHKDTVFSISRFFLTACVSHETLYLALGLVGMHRAAVFIWFSYSSFGVYVSDISWRLSKIVSYCYRIFGKWGPVLSCGFDCFYLIFA